MGSDRFGALRAELTMAFQPAGSESELCGGLHWKTRASSEVSVAALLMKQGVLHIETAQSSGCSSHNSIETHRLHPQLDQFPILPLKHLSDMPSYVSLVRVIRLSLRKTERLAMVAHQPFLETGGTVGFIGDHDSQLFGQCKGTAVEEPLVEYT